MNFGNVRRAFSTPPVNSPGRIISALTYANRSWLARRSAFANMSASRGVPFRLRATSGIWTSPSSRAHSATPSSLPNRMISGRGCNLVQLAMALRWMVSMCPLNGLGIARIVIGGEASESSGLEVPRLTRRVTSLRRAQCPTATSQAALLGRDAGRLRSSARRSLHTGRGAQQEPATRSSRTSPSAATSEPWYHCNSDNASNVPSF